MPCGATTRPRITTLTSRLTNRRPAMNWADCASPRPPTNHRSPKSPTSARSQRLRTPAHCGSKFTAALRLRLALLSESSPSPTPRHGRGRRGRHRIESLPARRMTWYWGLGSVTSDKLYAEVEKVEVTGVPPGWEVIIITVDYTRQDQTLLLPIWAGLARGDRLEALLRKTITDPNRYWRPYGIPNCAATDPAFAPDNRNGSGGVWMMWNTMIGEGLADAGYRAEAAELIRRLMDATLFTLKTEKAFREAYNCDKLEGLGERDYLWGVAPVHLFLRTVGIRIISPRKVWLRGFNPFPWPVTVRWHGVRVTKAGQTTMVKFPSGKKVMITGEVEQFVEDACPPPVNSLTLSTIKNTPSAMMPMTSSGRAYS